MGCQISVLNIEGVELDCSAWLAYGKNDASYVLNMEENIIITWYTIAV